jgi:hypothetical protein
MSAILKVLSRIDPLVIIGALFAIAYGGQILIALLGLK